MKRVRKNRAVALVAAVAVVAAASVAAVVVVAVAVAAASAAAAAVGIAAVAVEMIAAIVGKPPSSQQATMSEQQSASFAVHFFLVTILLPFPNHISVTVAYVC
jgi:hypothetical protein